MFGQHLQLQHLRREACGDSGKWSFRDTLAAWDTWFRVPVPYCAIVSLHCESARHRDLMTQLASTSASDDVLCSMFSVLCSMFYVPFFGPLASGSSRSDLCLGVLKIFPFFSSVSFRRRSRTRTVRGSAGAHGRTRLRGDRSCYGREQRRSEGGRGGGRTQLLADGQAGLLAWPA